MREEGYKRRSKCFLFEKTRMWIEEGGMPADVIVFSFIKIGPVDRQLEERVRENRLL